MRRPTPEIAPRRRLLHRGKKRTNPEADQSGGRCVGSDRIETDEMRGIGDS
jgi:hypothetical protein